MVAHAHTKMTDILITDVIERPQKTWMQVAERLQNLILTKKLLPGSKLPPERVLCQQLGVSRTVLREATKLLSARGLVEEVMGKGTFVSKPNLNAIKSSLEICLGWHAQAVLDNLVELRRLIEVEIAGLAAINATKNDLAGLWRNVRVMESTVDDNVKKFTELDLAFHADLARATHNELFVILFEAISSAMVDTWGKMYWDLKVRKHGVRFHKRILAAIDQRDAQGARRAVRENIEAFKHDVLSHAE